MKIIKQVLIILTINLLVALAPIMAYAENDFLGHTITGLPNLPDDQIEQFLTEMEELGAKWIRVGIWWNDIEPHNPNIPGDEHYGYRDFSKLDNIVTCAVNHNIKLLVNVSAISSWGSDYPDDGIDFEHRYTKKGYQATYPPKEFGQDSPYANFIYELVRYYQGQGVVWQIQNEPNGTVFWMKKVEDDETDNNGEVIQGIFIAHLIDKYTALLRDAYYGAHRDGQNATVITAGLGCGFVRLDRERKEILQEMQKRWFDAILEVKTYDGSRPPYDAIDLHNYYPPEANKEENPWGETFGEYIQRHKDWMKEKNVNVPIWMTETGINSQPIDIGNHHIDFDEERQSKDLELLYTIAKSHGIKHMFWIKLVDKDEYAFSYMGLKTEEPEYRYKFSWYTYQRLAKGYDNYPQIKVGMYSLKPPEDYTIEDIQFIADHYDWAIGTMSVSLSDLKAINSRPLVMGYNLLTSFSNDEEWINQFVNNYNNSHIDQIDPEDLYLHYLGDSADNYYVRCPNGGGTSDPYCQETFAHPSGHQVYGYNPDAPGTPAEGCIASSSLDRATSRVHDYYAQGWYFPDYRNPYLINYFNWYVDWSFTWALPGYQDGALLDNPLWPNSLTKNTGAQMTNEYWEFHKDPNLGNMDPYQELIPNQIFYDLLNIHTAVMNYINGVYKNTKLTWPANVPNMYTINLGSIYASAVLHTFDDLFIEVFLDINNAANAYYDAYNSTILTYERSGMELKSILAYTNNLEKNIYLNTYERVSGKSERGQIESLAMYYLVQGPNTRYSYEATDPANRQNLRVADTDWNKAVEVNLGDSLSSPPGAKDIFGNTDTINFYNFLDPEEEFECPIVDLQKYIAKRSIVFARNYTNGLVLLKLQATYSNTEGTGDGSAVEYPLGATYYLVRANGTVDPRPITSISLKNSEGAVLLNNLPPVFNDIGDKIVNEAEPLTFAVSAENTDGDALTYSANNLPIGAVFDASTKTFSWTPNYNQAGIYAEVHFEVTDGKATDSKDVTITVNNVKTPPELAPIGSRIVRESRLLTFKVSADDPDSNELTFSASNLPEGATFDASTKTFRWWPTYFQAKVYAGIHFEVSDGELSDYEDITITVQNVNRPPIISPIQDKTVNPGNLLTLTVTTTDPDIDDQLLLSATNLPSGAIFVDQGNGTGIFNWTPASNTAGFYPGVIFTVSDGELAASRQINITVIQNSTTPVLGNINPVNIDAGQNLTFTISATDADGNSLTFSASNLPSGASLTNSGNNAAVFSWIPTSAQIGVYTVEFKVTDTNGLSDTKSVTITVNAVDTNQAPSLNTIGNKVVEVNKLLSFVISATDPDNDPLTFSASNLPQGATFNSASGTFSWRPNYNQAGIYPIVHFEVSDGVLSDSEDIIIAVTLWSVEAYKRPQKLTLEEIGDKEIDEGQQLTFSVSALAPDIFTRVYLTASNLPAGATFTDNKDGTGTFDWTPDYNQAGTYTEVHFEASDNTLTKYEDITITVNNVNQSPKINPINAKKVKVGELLTFTITAVDLDNDRLTYTMSGLPIGGTNDPVLDPNTGIFAWKADAAQAGIYYNIYFTVDDGRGGWDFQSITITVTGKDTNSDITDEDETGQVKKSATKSKGASHIKKK